MRILLIFLTLASVLYGQGTYRVMRRSAGGSSAATPTDSPGAGTYSSTQSVTLTCPTAGSSGCYTIDASTPGAATPGTCDGSPTTAYSGAISVSTTTTIKAICTKAALTNSGVLTSLYTISAGRQFLIPLTAYINSGAARQFLIPGVGYINQ